MILQKLRSPQEGLVVLVSPLLEKPAYRLRKAIAFEKRFTHSKCMNNLPKVVQH